MPQLVQRLLNKPRTLEDLIVPGVENGSFHEGLTLCEIGEVLGVTESRVSQLHTKAILRLEAHLSGEAREPAQT